MEDLNIDSFILILNENQLVLDSNFNNILFYGSSGIVYDKMLNNKQYVIKIFKTPDTFLNIKKIGKKYHYLYKNNIGPELIKICIYTNKKLNSIKDLELLNYGILMEKYDMDLKKYLSSSDHDNKINILTKNKLKTIEKKISNLIDKTYKLNFIYTDLKFSNIIIKTDKQNNIKISLTDFDNYFCYDNTGKNKILNIKDKKKLVYLLKMGLCVESIYCHDEYIKKSLNIIYKEDDNCSINTISLIKFVMENSKINIFTPFFYSSIKRGCNLVNENSLLFFLNKMKNGIKNINTSNLIINPLNNLYVPLLKFNNGLYLHILLKLGNPPDNKLTVVNNVLFKTDVVLSLYFIFMKMR